MAQDFAKKNKRHASATRGQKTRKRSSSPVSTAPWVWLLGGVLIGLFIAGLMELKKIHLPHIPASQALHEHHPSRYLLAKEAKAPSHPQYDFYTILPKMKVWSPEAESKTATAVAPLKTPMLAQSQSRSSVQTQTQAKIPTKTKKPSATPIDYLLQVAAFRKYDEADQLKAQLTLLGYGVAIKSFMVHGQKWHHVWVGPFKTDRAAAEAQKNLAQQKLSSMIVKIAALPPTH